MRLQNIYSYFQCVCAATILMINYSNAQNEESDDLEISRSKSVEWIGSCETDEIIKAETYGLSALSLVEKLKYCLKNDRFQVASVAPENIIGANELWVFNVKYRKLGKYIAKNIDSTGQNREGAGLSVKGASIIGFDPVTSIQKTLRKPTEQLKDFKTAGKVKLRKFLENIETTDSILNGRCNNDTILLKVQ